MSARKAAPAGQAPDGFGGFRPAALAFFTSLAANNEKAWFEANRATYEREVQAPLRALVAALATELSRRKIPLTGDPMKALFRLNRDVRFSKDKSPYKTQAGAILSRDGSKDRFGLLYIHIDPQGSFAAAGFYQPEPRLLEALRTSMFEEAPRLDAALAALHAAGAELMREDALTRLPRGFEHAAGTPSAELIKLRSLVARRALSPAALAKPGLVNDLADFAEAALPLLQFGWESV